MFIGTVPVYIGILVKISPYFSNILIQHSFPKILYVHWKTVRGRKKSLKALVDYAKTNGYELSSQTLAFCHGEDEEALRFLLTLADEELKPKDKLISTVGCAIGAHTGRGIAGLCFLDASEEKYREFL